MKQEVITSRQNALIQQFRKLQSSKSARAKAGLYVADGTKLLQEAAKWCEGLQCVLCTPEVDVSFLPPLVQVYRIAPELMEYVSEMRAPQGALFACRLPDEQPATLAPGTLILDGIQDPGNMGTILRTADALEIPVVRSEGCADPYNPKTVRASMGAVFRTQPQFLSRAEVIAQCQAHGIVLAATAMSDDAVDIRSAEPGRCCVVIGSEGRGVCEEFLSAAKRKMIIPMSARCESLNAAIAAAIVMWQMKA